MAILSGLRDGCRGSPRRGTYLSSLLNSSVFCWLTALSNHAARATSMATESHRATRVDARERMTRNLEGRCEMRCVDF